jgi:N-acetylmuramoyl-L-alanine amidase
MNTRLCCHARLLTFALMLAGGLITTTPVVAEAQTVQTKYDRALARERTARADATPSVATLRSIAGTYENIVRLHPRSGYADNALWQGAGLLQLAWETAGQTRDRDQAVKLLQWLKNEYPTSSLARQVNARVTTLNRPRPSTARTAPRPVTPPPASNAGPSPTRSTVEAADAAPAANPRTMAAAGNAAEPSVVPAPRPAAESPATTVAPGHPGDPVQVRGLSHTTLPRGDRVTLELSQEATFSAGTPSAAGDVMLVVTNARASAAIVSAANSIRGSMIRGMRIENTDGGLRLTVATTGQARQSAFPLYGPNRLVFDFEAAADLARPAASSLPSHPATAGTAAAAREPSAPVPAASAAANPMAGSPSAAVAVAAAVAAATADPSEQAEAGPAPPASIRGSYSLARQLGLGVSRIVIDPGHGGADPGAQDNGVTEAALVLDVALRLERLLLAQPGFEVVLTRRTNEAVPLARRTAIANEEAADLFLSIHANSSPRRETAGVETYFLNLATNKQAESVAARENASSAQAMRTLPQLVRAITTNNKLAESRELAGVVQASLVGRLRGRNRLFQDLGVKQAPFMVLIGAQMPSVLAEIAFVSNRTEAGLLKQNAYKQQIAQALCDAILRYRGSLKKMTTVAASAEGR